MIAEFHAIVLSRLYYNFLYRIFRGWPRTSFGRIMEISELNQYSLRRFHRLFASLAIPETDRLAGRYRGVFVGPGWVRALAAPALIISGLGGWWGKDIYEDGKAINIVQRQGKFSTCFPMAFVREQSQIDGREGAALHYQKGNPFPWMFIVDEMRRIDETRLLGMTRPNIPGLRWFALPFILQKQKS
jgi:hypothetical protein